MDQIPKPLIVIACFIAAIVGIMALQPQYSACSAQIEIFRKNMQGEIFPAPSKRFPVPARLKTHISTCKAGNSPGSCREVFESLRKVNRQIRGFPESCYADLAAVEAVKGSLEESMALLAQLAWGEAPPENLEARFRWFEAGDLAVFCETRNNYIRLFTQEVYDSFRVAVAGQLPGEEAQFIDGKCVNCDSRKKAKDVFPPDEVWKRSLFSTACSKFL